MNFDRSIQTQYEQTFKKNKAQDELLEMLAKTARKAIKENGQWIPDFNKTEVIAVISLYQICNVKLREASLKITELESKLNTGNNNENI